MQLNGSVKCFEQGKAANVTDEDASSRADRAQSATDDVNQIVEVRKILNDGVDDYRVELVLNAVEFMGSFARQCDIGKAEFRASNLLFQKIHCRLGNVSATEELSLGSNAEKQKTGSAPDLPDSLGAKRKNALDGGFHPDAHFFRRNRFPRIAAIPSSDVESRVFAGAALAVRIIECDRPLF